MAHLVFANTQPKAEKTKRAIFCLRTDKTVNKKMKQIDTNKIISLILDKICQSRICQKQTT